MPPQHLLHFELHCLMQNSCFRLPLVRSRLLVFPLQVWIIKNGLSLQPKHLQMQKQCHLVFFSEVTSCIWQVSRCKDRLLSLLFMFFCMFIFLQRRLRGHFKEQTRYFTYPSTDVTMATQSCIMWVQELREDVRVSFYEQLAR